MRKKKTGESRPHGPLGQRAEEMELENGSQEGMLVIRVRLSSRTLSRSLRMVLERMESWTLGWSGKIAKTHQCQCGPLKLDWKHTKKE